VQVSSKDLTVPIRHLSALLRHGRSLAITLAGSAVVQSIQMQLVDKPVDAI